MKKRLLCLLLLAALCLMLCACGNDVPGLKLNWGMSPEEVQKAVPAEMRIDQLENNAYIICFDSDKIPKVMGQKVLVFECRFDNYKLWNVNVTFDASVDFETVLSKCTKKYGEPNPISGRNESIYGFINVKHSAMSWTTEDSVILLTYHENAGFSNFKFLDELSFYSRETVTSALDSVMQAQPTPEPTAEPAAVTPAPTEEPETPEERFARLVREDLSGTWISADDVNCKLRFGEDGTISINGETYSYEFSSEYEEGLRFVLMIDRKPVYIFWEPENDVFCSEGLPGVTEAKNYQSTFFYREGTQNPGEPFFGTWTLSSGPGFTWAGAVIRTITVTPEGGLIMDGRDIGLSMNLYDDDPSFPTYRWGIWRYEKDKGDFRAFLETADPFADPQDLMLIICDNGRSFYKRG